MMKLLVAKVLCMGGVFFFMLLGSLLPVRIIEADFEKAHRSKKVLSLCNTFGGGVFLATCFNALLPAVRKKTGAATIVSCVYLIGKSRCDTHCLSSARPGGRHRTVMTSAMKDKSAVTVSAMIPVGIGAGLGIESAQGVPSSVASVLLQGLAGGTFLFVTFFEILAKELEEKSDRLLKVLFLVLGYAVLAVMGFLNW
nr:zinc transporter ZIP3 [Loxodonta africana]